MRFNMMKLKFLGLSLILFTLNGHAMLRAGLRVLGQETGALRRVSFTVEEGFLGRNFPRTRMASKGSRVMGGSSLMSARSYSTRGDYKLNDPFVDPFKREEVNKKDFEWPASEKETLPYFDRRPTLLDEKEIPTESPHLNFKLDQMDENKRGLFISAMETLFPGLKFTETKDGHTGYLTTSEEMAQTMPLSLELLTSVMKAGSHYKTTVEIADSTGPGEEFVTPHGVKTYFYQANINQQFLIHLDSGTNEALYMRDSESGEEIERRGSFYYLHALLHEWVHVFRTLNGLDVSEYDYQLEEEFVEETANKLWQEVMKREKGKPYYSIGLQDYWR